MAARNRPRTGQIKDDADEERNIWNILRSEAKKGDQLISSWNELNSHISELAKEQENALIAGSIPSPKTDDELERLIREGLPIVGELLSLIEGDSDSQNLSVIKGLELLSALRASSESDSVARSASLSGGGKPQRNLKRKHEQANASGGSNAAQNSAAAAEDKDSIAADSPGGPSPKVVVPARLAGRASSRSGSVPAGRESSVKVEDGDGGDGMRMAIATDRNKLQIGVEVFYRNKAKAAEGEGILCSITNIVGEGKQRRYEIRDSDPDPPTPPLPYRASVNHLVPIPPANVSLPDLPPRKQVLALYPGTTTFYKAEVVAPKVRKPNSATGDGSSSRDGQGELRDGFVRLRFEGEEEAEREMDVERRYVLAEASR